MPIHKVNYQKGGADYFIRELDMMSMKVNKTISGEIVNNEAELIFPQLWETDLRQRYLFAVE